ALAGLTRTHRRARMLQAYPSPSASHLPHSRPEIDLTGSRVLPVAQSSSRGGASMPILPSITGPRDLDRLTPAQLAELATEIRAFLVENVARTGGHLGPNLGVVELMIALHRVFSS